MWFGGGDLRLLLEKILMCAVLVISTAHYKNSQKGTRWFFFIIYFFLPHDFWALSNSKSQLRCDNQNVCGFFLDPVDKNH